MMLKSDETMLDEHGRHRSTKEPLSAIVSNLLDDLDGNSVCVAFRRIS